jgi:coenzyme F420-reducing hydrogenase beta subunit
MDAIKLAKVGSKYDCDSRLTVGTPSTIDAAKKKNNNNNSNKEIKL